MSVKHVLVSESKALCGRTVVQGTGTGCGNCARIAKARGLVCRTEGNGTSIRDSIRTVHSNPCTCSIEQSGLDVLADLLSLDGTTPAKVVVSAEVQADRDAAKVRNVMGDWRGKTIRYSDGRLMIVGEHRHDTVRLSIAEGPRAGESVWYPANQVWAGMEAGTITEVLTEIPERSHVEQIADVITTEIRDAGDFDATPTGDLFNRALSIGYDNEAAARLADCWENWDMIGDPCLIHPNHSVSRDHQGFHVNGCEACEVIRLSDAKGFASKLPATCRICTVVRASTTLELSSKFIGSMNAPDTADVPVCDACYGKTLDTVQEGEDHTIVYAVWPNRFNVAHVLLVPVNPTSRYRDAEIADTAYELARKVSPGLHIPMSGYIVYDPARREAYDVSLGAGHSEVRELTPGEAASLAWEHFGKPNIRISPRLHVTLTELHGRIAMAESAEIFHVSSNGVDGRLHNPSFNHRIVKYRADSANGCCDDVDKFPGHLHMSAQPSVISLAPQTLVVRIECRIGDRFVIDRVPYILTNRRYADPILVPESV